MSMSLHLYPLPTIFVPEMGHLFHLPISIRSSFEMSYLQSGVRSLFDYIFLLVNYIDFIINNNVFQSKAYHPGNT